jgi:hypothetical protein
MALHRIEHGADEMALLQEGKEALGLGRADDLGLHAEIAALGMGGLQPVEPIRGIGEHHPAGEVDTAGLAGDPLQLLIEADGVLLELRDIGIAVQRMHPAGRMPGRARGQLVPLQQHEVGPACLGQVIEHRAADHAAPDHQDLDRIPHPPPLRWPRLYRLCGLGEGAGKGVFWEFKGLLGSFGF